MTASSPPAGTYGDPAPAITPGYAGFVLTDDAGDLDTPPTCSTTYTQGDSPGDYPTSCTGGVDTNYAFSYVVGTFHVNKKTLTVTASSPPAGTYGDPAPAITPGYAGFVLTDDAGDLDTPPTCSTTYTQGDSPGDYPTSCTGGVDTNYAFSYVVGTFHVNKKTLTVTASSPPAGTYGDPAPAITPGYAGFVLTDDAGDLDTPPTCSTTYTQGDSPGDYPTSCTGGVDTNYAFSYVVGTFHVNKKTLTVTASSPPAGTYGDPAPAITPGYAGFVLTDDAGDLDTPPTCSTTYTQGDSPGDYPTSCTGGVDTNYAFSYVVGTFHVNKKTLTVTASSPPAGTYGDPAPAITPGYAGFVLTDDAGDLDTPPTCSTTYTQGDSPGDYPTSCTGGVDTNYAFSYVVGTFHVNKKTLTVTASSPPAGTYGDPAPAITPGYAGFVLTDDAGDLDTPPTCSTTYTQGDWPGDYPTSCTGGVDTNYAFSYVVGTFHVNKKTLTVTASSPPAGTYGDPAPAITPGYAGFVLADDAGDLDTPPTCSTTYTQGDSPGDYPTSCTGGVDTNYAFSYVVGTFHVNKKTLTVTASSPPAGTYGDPAPAITPGYAGFVLTDDAGDLDTPPTCSTTYTQGDSPGDYPTSCTGGVDTNYAFSYVVGTFHVNKKTLTVTASSPPAGTYGDPAPAITPGYAGFVLTDDAGDLDTPPTCSTTYTQGDSPGDYPTSCTGGVDTNYAFSYVVGTFHVNKKTLTVTPNPQNPSRQYSDPSPAIVPSYAGFVLGDDPGDLDTAPTCATTRTTLSAPGNYPITCSGGVDNDYAFSYAGGTFAVTKEDAQATYTGDMLAFSSGGAANVLLRATIRDASLFIPADTNPGDIRNATVKFMEEGVDLCTFNSPLPLLSPPDTKSATVECTRSLANGDHTIDIVINGYYMGSLETAVVQVTEPNGSFVTGGGYLVLSTTSSGSHAADAGSRMNYGFNVKYKPGKSLNPQGNVNIIFRRTVARSGAEVPDQEHVDRLPRHRAEERVSQLPRPAERHLLGPCGVPLQGEPQEPHNPGHGPAGGLSLEVTMTDKGEPGRNDTFASDAAERQHCAVLEQLERSCHGAAAGCGRQSGRPLARGATTNERGAARRPSLVQDAGSAATAGGLRETERATAGAITASVAPTAIATTPHSEYASPPRSASAAAVRPATRSVKPTRRPRSTGLACVTSSAEAATYETFHPRPRRKSESDMDGIATAHASITVDTAITRSPPISARCRPMRSMSTPTTRTRPNIPTMCRLITVNTSACSWSWPTTM